MVEMMLFFVVVAVSIGSIVLRNESQRQTNILILIAEKNGVSVKDIEDALK